MLDVCFGQDIEDKNSIAPRQHRPTWDYNDKLGIATLSIRGMKEFAKRKQIIQEIETNKKYSMCIQEAKLSDSIVGQSKCHTFVFSSNSNNNKEHHAGGICYSSKMEKYRNSYKQTAIL